MADRPSERLTRLATARAPVAASHNYSKVVGILRLVLPLLALTIVVVVMAWPKMDRIPERMAEDNASRKAGGNELVNPRFESQDKEGQPYVVTAARAEQSNADKDVVLLDKPHGHAILKNADVIDLTSDEGAYRQKAQRLMLKGTVTLNHVDGYVVYTDRLMVDMAAEKAWTDTDVRGSGPAGTLQAKGMQADIASGVLIFTGPATLIINRSVKGL